MSDRGRSPAPSGPGDGSQRRSSKSPSGRTTSPSRSAASGAAAGWVQGPGHDPARMGGSQREDKGNTRMELPPDAYVSETKKDLFTMRGNKFNTEGKNAEMLVNQYRMKKFDFSKKIFQYDIAVSPDRRPPMKKILASPELKQALGKYNLPTWIFDGRKLAWAPGLIERGEVRFQVDLDAASRAKGEKARESSIFHVTIRKTTEIHVSALQGYLEQKTSFNTTVQEAMNFIDHLLRAGPSERLVAIKRNFYVKDGKAFSLMDQRVVEVHKGIYASVRMSHNLTQGGIGLALNADVANTAFWVPGHTFDKVIQGFLATCEKRWSNCSVVDIGKELRPIPRRDGTPQSSDAFKHLRKLRKLKFTVQHRNRNEDPNNRKVYTLIDFMSGPKYGPEGATARNVKFDWNGKMTSVEDYYNQKYQVTLKYVHMPLIDAGKGGAVPIELAVLEPMQRYNFKLNPDQTANMIKIAVTRPKVRKEAIEEKVALLGLGNDSRLKFYGVEFEKTFTKTQAKILQPPILKFRGTGKVEPKFAGRWDLRGMKFWKPNVAPLGSWGIVVMDACVDGRVAEQFITTFRQVFTGHGGNAPSSGKVLLPPGNLKSNGGEVVNWAFNQLKSQSGYPQLLFIVVSHRNSPHYERLKKSCDCRFGILSQVVQRSHVQSNQGQYHSNVAMKVNAKLGGSTSRTDPPWKGAGPTYFPSNRPTMMVGVDVSHAAPGAQTASIAAVTMNVDADANRFVAQVETNGYRVEMLSPHNVHNLFGELVTHWKANHGQPPSHVMYFRDGVSEGQFSQVMDVEIAEIRRFFKSKGVPMPKFTVIVATKRHHIRLFPPTGGDRNANPLPGTLVEKEVTHPFMWDFYLNSHVAIQGTARPVHYYVLQDEMGIPVNEFQRMIYYQCYSYARSTTPVSIHPAVYYAHLAGARARFHENVRSTDGFRAGGKGHEVHQDAAAKGLVAGPGIPAGGGTLRGSEAPQLLRLGGVSGKEGPVAPGEDRQRQLFRGSMWYI